MISTTTDAGLWTVYGIAVLLGAVGGLIAELLLRGQAGRLEMPRLMRAKGLMDLGFIANIVVGAGAASAFLWFLGPTTVGTGEGATTGYDVRILVGASLVVGTAGGSMLAALAERAKAILTEQQKHALHRATIAALTKVITSSTRVSAESTDLVVSEQTMKVAISQINAIARFSSD